MVSKEHEGEWLQELEETVASINDGISELIELQMSLNSECIAMEVFAEHIVGDSTRDLSTLLDIMNPSNVLSADVWTKFGMRISGRRRGFRTCIEVNIPQFCSSPLDAESDCLVNAVCAARSASTRIGREATTDTVTEFEVVSPTPYQLKYINEANSEIKLLRTTQEELRKAL